MTREEIIPILKSYKAFENIKNESLNWLIDHGRIRHIKAGELTVEPGAQVEYMSIVLKGRYKVSFERDGKIQEFGEWTAVHITGLLPFSRLKVITAHARAMDDCVYLELHKDYFAELVSEDYELMQNLVAEMSDRIRNFEHQRTQEEKLMSLGKMAASLTHELNNPASAMTRSASELYKRIHSTPERFKAIMQMGITPEQTDEINGIIFKKIEEAPKVSMSLMEREEALDDLLDWMDDNQIDNGDDIADTLVDFNFNTFDLTKIQGVVGGDSIGILLWWVESTLNLERLIAEIQESATRISDLVSSVKNYSRMDKGEGKQPVDLHNGLDSTVTMLNPLLKKKNIQIDKQYGADLPQVKAEEGQLNQVWTNIISNAADALEKDGRITIKTYKHDDWGFVEIHDNGSGIPDDVINKIFDPFYTTKPLGEGTGLGLDISRRIVEAHEGRINVSSEPGSTTFKICIPAFHKK